MRQRQGAVLCSRCGRLVHVEERTCPHCGAVAPSLFGFAPALRKIFGPNADLVTLITVVCGALYLATLFASIATGEGIDWVPGWDMGSPGSRGLYLFGMTGGLTWLQGHWWTLLTANFLHGSLLHIGFNMMWARSLGTEAIESFGPARFFVIWCVSGMGGFALSHAWGYALYGFPTPTIGASAAIFGLLGALAAFGRRRGGEFGRGLSKQMWVWALLMGGFGFIMPNVNNAGHAGGFLVGLLLGYLMPLQGRARETRVVQGLALTLAVATALGVAASVFFGLRGMAG